MDKIPFMPPFFLKALFAVLQVALIPDLAAV